MTRRAIVLGMVAVGIAWLWQFLTVRYNYEGNWTGLFCIAPHMPVPDFLRSEKPHLFQNSDGYDGQVYHLIAHDPWIRRGSADAILSPAFRYQRILVPGLAWGIALGRDEWIHAAYIGVMLGFVFAGVYWLAKLAATHSARPVWGLGFLLTPAALISIDRMTVDIAAAALVVALALYTEIGARWMVFAVLAGIGLTRETGIVIIAGYALYLLTRRRFEDAMWAGLAGAPAVAWFLYVSRRLPERSPLIGAFTPIPLGGIVEAMFHPFAYALPAKLKLIAIIFDDAALAGVIVSVVLAAVLALRRRWSADAAVIYVLAAPTAFIRMAGWTDVYGFSRPLTPLMLLTAREYAGPGFWFALIPIALMDSRIALNFVGQIVGVIHGVTGIDLRALLK